MCGEVILEAEGIAVRRETRALLREASLALRTGELVIIVGPNGAGKSTLLRVLSGEFAPSAGTVTLRGRELGRWRKDELARVRAVLPQNSALDFPFTVFEVALLGRLPHARGMHPTRRDRQIAWAALELTSTAELSARLYPTLSGGERQRVQLARVLAQIWESDEPRCLLLDEPTTNLDLVHQHATLKIARAFAERNTGVIAVLHDLNLAAQYADRVAVLHRGEIVAIGPVSDALAPELVHRVFGLETVALRHPELTTHLLVPKDGACKKERTDSQ